MLFILGAAPLAICGAIFFHAEWPPANWPHVSFTTSDFGAQLVLCAAVFAVIGLLYLVLTSFLRLQLKAGLGYLHFLTSSAAILVGVFLDYWLSVSYRTAPGEGFLSSGLHVLGRSFEGTLWAMIIFGAAQLVFLLNITLTIVARFRRAEIA
jgi:hypothetical protein